MREIIFEALKLIVMVVALLLTRYVIPWIKKCIGNEQLATITTWATEAVLWAQQTMWSASGEERKQKVLELLKSIATKKNIDITDEELNVLIEAAVREMKQDEGTVPKTTTKKTTVKEST